MKIIDKILKRFGYIKESQVSKDLDFVLNYFNIRSIEELKASRAGFAELWIALQDNEPDKTDPNMKNHALKEKLENRNFVFLQDHLNELMVEQGYSGKWEDLTKEQRKQIFQLAVPSVKRLSDAGDAVTVRKIKYDDGTEKIILS